MPPFSETSLDRNVNCLVIAMYIVLQVLTGHMPVVYCVQLNKKTHGQVNKFHREEYQKFLETAGKKGALFRDIIIESEYDPMTINRECIKYKLGKVNDPTRCMLEKREEELRMINPDASIKSCSGRDTLDVMQWGTGKVESTPHGYFARLMSAESNVPASREKKINKSSVSGIYTTTSLIDNIYIYPNTNYYLFHFDR